MDVDEKLPANDAPAGVGRRQLIRDIVVLQLKLLVDGFRDLLLVPTSLIVGLVSLFGGEDGQRGVPFYRLLVLGKQSERWIDLFGALKNAPAESLAGEPFTEGGIDDLIGKLESYVTDEYKAGGVTAQAKEHFDAFLRAAKKRRT